MAVLLGIDCREAGETEEQAGDRIYRVFVNVSEYRSQEIVELLVESIAERLEKSKSKRRYDLLHIRECFRMCTGRRK